MIHYVSVPKSLWAVAASEAQAVPAIPDEHVNDLPAIDFEIIEVQPVIPVNLKWNARRIQIILDRPNKIKVKANVVIFVTDPVYAKLAPHDHAGVYNVADQLGRVRRMSFAELRKMLIARGLA